MTSCTCTTNTCAWCQHIQQMSDEEFRQRIEDIYQKAYQQILENMRGCLTTGWKEILKTVEEKKKN